VTVVIRLADEVEVDERWSSVGRKKDQSWLWHAIDHGTGNLFFQVHSDA
jgi:insertion element IS1 protein InsB